MKAAIIKLGALGDVLLSTPAIKAIVERHRHEELFLLTSPQYAELFSAWAGLNTVHFPRSGVSASIRAAAWLRAQHFDRIYDLQSNDRSRLLCCLSGAKELIGNHNHFPYTHHPGDRYAGQNHIFERHQQVLASVGIKMLDKNPSLPVPKRAKENVLRWMQKHGIDGQRMVLLHAGASPLRPEKRWPHFSRLAEMLAASHYQLVWLGANDDALVNAGLVKQGGIDATNVFNIFELIELGKQALFALTNDSGPMHVLACAGLPVFALFGPSNWRRNHAIGQKDHVISLNKSNSVWRAEDFADSDAGDLGLITAEMVWSLLVEENYIGP